MHRTIVYMIFLHALLSRVEGAFDYYKYSMAGMCEGSFPECADHHLQAMSYRLIDLACVRL